MTQINVPGALRGLMSTIEQAGGRPFLVGGFVRDAVLGLEPKDADIEVFGLDGATLLRLMHQVGPTNVVGQSFGVIKVDVSNFGQIDVSIPRRESKQGRGHTGFLPEFDPTLTTQEAAARRDFTINSLMANPHGVVTDHFDGLSDIRRRVLRAVSPAFADDALRVLRGVQFASRFGLTMDQHTADMCRLLLPEFPTLSRERVWEELWKWANGKHPGKGLEVLEQTGWLAAFPVLDALRFVKQDTEWHPELFVWAHTVQAVEEAGTRSMSPVVVLAALFHDVGKTTTTATNEDGRITSHGHAEAGAEMTEKFLRSVVRGAPDLGRIIRGTTALVREHMAHTSGRPTPRAVRRLANRLAAAGVTMVDLTMLAEADASGRFPAPPASPMLGWLEVAESLSIAESGPVPLLQGRDLINLGLPPGPAFGDLLRMAFEAQLDGEFTTTEGAIEWLTSRVNVPLLCRQLVS